MIYVLLLLLVVSREVAGDSTAYVGDPTALDKENYPVTTLLAALQDASVTNVVLVSNYRVGEAFHDATPAPLQIQRRVSLAAVAAVSLVVTDNRTTLQANHSYFGPCFDHLTGVLRLRLQSLSSTIQYYSCKSHHVMLQLPTSRCDCACLSIFLCLSPSDSLIPQECHNLWSAWSCGRA